MSPPGLFPLRDDFEAAFGLQKPVPVGRWTVKVRSVTFVSEGPVLEGQLVKIKAGWYLVLRGDGPRWDAIAEALAADGLEPWQPGPVFPADRGPSFTGPSTPEPAPKSDPAAAFLLDRLRDGLRMARQYEKGVRDDVDTECLHLYRVWLRKVRSLTSLGRMWEVIPEWNRLKAVLRTLQQKTNELRDLDVLLLDIPGLQDGLPWDEGARLSGWVDSLGRRRQAEFRRVKAWLGSEDHRRASDEADRLLEDLAGLGSRGRWANGRPRRFPGRPGRCGGA